MAAVDDGCLDIKQHLNTILKPGNQNQSFQKNRNNKQRKKKAKAGKNLPLENHETSTNSLMNASLGANQNVFCGKEIVDFVPNSISCKITELPLDAKNVQGDVSDNVVKNNTTLSSSQNTSHCDEVDKVNSLSELLISVLPNQQANSVQDVEAAHGLKTGNKKRNKPKKKKNNKPKSNSESDSNSMVSHPDKEHKAENISKPQMSDLPEQESLQEDSHVLNKKGARNKANKEYRKNVVQDHEQIKEKKPFNKKEFAISYQAYFEEELAKLTPDLKEFLKSEYIFPLDELYLKFPKAVLHCSICKYFCSMKDYTAHIEKDSHVKMKNIQDEEYFFQTLRSPSEVHCLELSKLLKNISIEHGLSSDDLKDRQAVAKRLTQIIQENGLPECELQVYGSSLTGFGTKDSDLNLNLIYSSSLESIPVILSKLEPILNDCDDLTDFGTDLQAKVPKIFFKDKHTNLKCDVTWTNIASVRTSRLLYLYSNLDPRVHYLGVAFKYWAKMCEIDCQEKGTLASHGYAIMLIYFLQQVKPAVLPALEIQLDFDVDNVAVEAKKVKWISFNKRSIGELWTELLRFYVVTYRVKSSVVCIRTKKRVSKAERKWTGSIIAIEDPNYQKRNLARSISHFDVFCYIWERLKTAYKYFGVPQSKEGPLILKPNSTELKFTQNKGTHDLTLESSDLSSLEEMESADEEEDYDEEEEDEYDDDHPDWKRKNRRRRRNTSDASRESIELERHSSSSDDELLQDHDPEITLDDLKLIEKLDLGDDQNLSTESESTEAGPELTSPSKKSDTASPLRKATVAVRLAEKGSCEKPPASPSHSNENHNCAAQETNLYYQFNKDILTEEKCPPLYCRECGEQGHLKNNCPSLHLPPLEELSPLSQSYRKLLDEACLQVMSNHAPSKKEVEMRKAAVEELEIYIQRFYPDASLELFGSSCNGFGFAGSDMDICLTFADSKEMDLDHGGIIGSLATFLQSNRDVRNILAITTAKVPIVKFNYYDLECDISLYNTLAQHNTRMLLTYSKIDQRVQVLGYTMKLFVKLCNIGDASRGSLSSYAYILMVIHFLQQRKPAVIPVLQELYPKDGACPVVMVDGWNAWFYEDLENLAAAWPEMGQNTESIGDLWLGLLRFYTEEFDFKTTVVSIRQKALLTRLEKFWNTKIICVEDPFDLNHNLGVGVSRKMSTYIMKALIKGRGLFGKSFEDVNTPSLKHYLFDQQKLSTEDPPNDRGCHICGKIGHKMKDCPKKRGPQKARWRKRQDQSHQERRGQNDRQRNGAARYEVQTKSEPVGRPEQSRTRERKSKAPTIAKDCKLMQNIKNYLESSKKE